MKGKIHKTVFGYSLIVEDGAQWQLVASADDYAELVTLAAKYEITLPEDEPVPDFMELVRGWLVALQERST